MAVQVETRGQLQDFLEILKKRSWQVILPAAFVIALGSAFAVLVPKKYVAKTQVELRPIGLSVSSKEASNAPFQIKSIQRIKKVLQDLKNPEYLAIPPEDRRDFQNDIADDIKVTLAKGGTEWANFVNIEYADVNPQWTRDFLNALREDWIQDVLEIDRNKLQDELDKLRDEKSKLEKQHTRELELVTDIRRRYGLSATQPISGDGTRIEDPAFARLQQYRSQLETNQLELETKRVKIEAQQKRYDEMPEFLSSEETVAGTSNAAQLEAADADIQDLQDQLKRIRQAHHRFRELQKKIQDLQERREQLSHVVTQGETLAVKKPNPERAPLLKEIENQKVEAETLAATQKKLQELVDRDDRRVAELQTVYLDLRVHTEFVGRLEVALADSERKYQDKAQQVKIVQGPLANPFALTIPVDLPRKPSEPNPWIIVAFSLVAGFGLGIGLAVTLEFSKNCFRSVHDISRVMVVPVLGSINTIITRREARLSSAKRVLIGVSSIVLIGSVVFVTWAWRNNPGLLSPNMLQKIEAFRSKFR